MGGFGPALPDDLVRSCKVVSFDLFDTLLLRTVTAPVQVFHLVGRRAAAEGICSEGKFVRARLRAEKLLRVKLRLPGRQEETTLDEIYRVARRLLRVPVEASRLLAEEEMRQERRVIEPNRELVPLVREFAERRRVVYISDMYLPGSFVQGILAEHGLPSSIDRIYMSSEVGLRKRTGRLFDEVARREGVRPGELLHVGDHEQHDVSQARRRGVQAVLYRRDRAEVPWLPAIGRAGLAEGVMRHVADETFAAGKDRCDEDLRTISCHVAAPTLFAFAHWVVEQARRRGLERLYFVARDGRIVQRIAERICRHSGLDLDLRYLRGSRHSWLMPSLARNGAFLNEPALFRLSKGLTLRRLLRRVKLIEPFPRVDGLELDEPIDIVRLAQARRVLGRPEIRRAIELRAERDFTLTDGYLRQEGLHDEVRRAVVDIGWRGSTARALERLLQRGGAPTSTVTALYFDAVPGVPLDGELASFVRDAGRPYRGLRGELEVMLEIFCSIDEESTFGYRSEGGRYEAVGIDEAMEPLIRWGIREHHSMVLDFTERLLGHTAYADLRPSEVHRCCIDGLFRFLAKPPAGPARRIGAMPYSVQQERSRDDPYSGVCRRFSTGDLVSLIRARNIMREDDLWVQGSLALTESRLAKAIFATLYRVLASWPVRRLERLIVERIAPRR